MTPTMQKVVVSRKIIVCASREDNEIGVLSKKSSHSVRSIAVVNCDTTFTEQGTEEQGEGQEFIA